MDRETGEISPLEKDMNAGGDVFTRSTKGVFPCL